MYNTKVAAVLATLGVVGIAATTAMADPFAVTRGNLARNATFTVTQTVAPKNAAPVTQVYRVEVKGEKARVDFSDQTMGSQRFLVNEKGYSGSRAGITAGVTDARGRQIARMARGLDGTAPQDIVGGDGSTREEDQ